MIKIWGIFFLCFLSGCGNDYKHLPTLLNEGQVEGCLWFAGSAGPYVSITGVYSRGGVPLENCLDARHP